MIFKKRERGMMLIYWVSQTRTHNCDEKITVKRERARMLPTKGRRVREFVAGRVPCSIQFTGTICTVRVPSRVTWQTDDDRKWTHHVVATPSKFQSVIGAGCNERRGAVHKQRACFEPPVSATRRERRSKRCNMWNSLTRIVH